MPLSIWIALVGISLTVLVQFAGIVWFAATQRQLLAAQQGMMRELKSAVESLKHIASSLDRRVAVLEDRASRV